MKIRIIIILLIFSVISCQKPHLIKTDQEEISPIFTEGITFQRQNYLNANISFPLILKDNETLNGLPTETIILVRDRIVLTTRNGYLFILHLDDLDDNSKTRISRGISAAPTFSRGYLYIASEVGENGLYVYDIHSGETAWTLEGYLSKSSPIVVQNRVFHASLNGSLICLNAINGQKIWESIINDKISCSLAFHDDHLIAATENGIIRSYEPTSGSINWGLELNESVFVHPMIVNNLIFIATYQGNVYTINLKSGNIIAKKSYGLHFYTPPSTDGDWLFLPLSNGQLIASDLTGNKTYWKIQLDGPPTISALVTDKTIFIGTGQKYFYAVNKENGEIVQKIELEGRPSSMPLIHDEKVILNYEYKNIATFVLNQEQESASDK